MFIIFHSVSTVFTPLCCSNLLLLSVQNPLPGAHVRLSCHSADSEFITRRRYDSRRIHFKEPIWASTGTNCRRFRSLSSSLSALLLSFKLKSATALVDIPTGTVPAAFSPIHQRWPGAFSSGQRDDSREFPHPNYLSKRRSAQSHSVPLHHSIFRIGNSALDISYIWYPMGDFSLKALAWLLLLDDSWIKEPRVCPNPYKNESHYHFLSPYCVSAYLSIHATVADESWGWQGKVKQARKEEGTTTADARSFRIYREGNCVGDGRNKKRDGCRYTGFVRWCWCRISGQDPGEDPWSRHLIE